MPIAVFLSAIRGRCLLAMALALGILCVLAPVGLAAGWSIAAAPSGDGASKAAVTSDPGGHKLYIWAKHLADRSLVFAELHLEDGSEFGGRMPVYSIDDGKPIDTELVRREGEKQGSLWGFVAGRACFWLIWSSNQQTVEADDHLAKWMNGKILKVRYLSADGSQKDIEFSLDGSLSAIEQATGVSLP